MTADPKKALIRLIMDQVRNRGWRDEGGAAYGVSMALLQTPVLLSDRDAFRAFVPEQFKLANSITSDQLLDALLPIKEQCRALASEAALLGLPAIIPMEMIDSFAEAGDVPATDVAAWTKPLDMLEDDIERMIAQIIGQPYRQKDWGGELDDLFTGQVRLAGVTVATSFLLKGRGVRSVLKPKHLGKNADQITRMVSQPADLFIVQHVHGVDASVRQQLENAVTAKRAQGRAAVGSVWEGVDVGRLGVAYRILDPTDGTLVPGALTSE